MEGQVYIERTADKTMTSEDIDFEQSWWDGPFLVLKGYDRTGAIVLIRVRADLLIQELKGMGLNRDILAGIVDLSAWEGRGKPS